MPCPELVLLYFLHLDFLASLGQGAYEKRFLLLPSPLTAHKILPANYLVLQIAWYLLLLITWCFKLLGTCYLL